MGQPVFSVQARSSVIRAAHAYKQAPFHLHPTAYRLTELYPFFVQFFDAYELAQAKSYPRVLECLRLRE